MGRVFEIFQRVDGERYRQLCPTRLVIEVGIENQVVKSARRIQLLDGSGNKIA